MACVPGKAETPSLRSQPGSHGLWGVFHSWACPKMLRVLGTAGGLESLGVSASAHTVCVCSVPGPVGSWAPPEGTRQGTLPSWDLTGKAVLTLSTTSQGAWASLDAAPPPPAPHMAGEGHSGGDKMAEGGGTHTPKPSAAGPTLSQDLGKPGPGFPHRNQFCSYKLTVHLCSASSESLGVF